MARMTRDDIAVHLLAQLPDDVRLEVGDDPSLALLARAYGVEDRVGGAAVDTSRPFAELVDELGDARPAARVRGDDSVLAGHRVAIVTNVPMHYRLPLFAALAERLTAAGATLRVLLQAPAPADRPWMTSELSVDHDVVGGDPREALARFDPTMVLAGGFGRSAIRASAYARGRARFGIWSGATAAIRAESGRLRRLQRRWLLRRAGFAVAYGIAAHDYLRDARPGLPVTIMRNTSVVEVAARDRKATPTVRLLIVNRLEQRKAVDVAISALRRSPSLDCRLTIVGDGPERASLERMAAADERIVFTGALPPTAARAAYANADAFLFPTRIDVFGHVLVEAMAEGLPVAVAGSAGAVEDLCVDGKNSLVLLGHEPETWAAAIERLVTDPGHRRDLGRRAAATVAARWTLDHSADAMVAALRLGALTGR